MSNSAAGLNGAWAAVTTPPSPTAAEEADRRRRVREDFRFLTICASKGSMGVYNLFRDKSLDSANQTKV